ncbi:MAG: hypothetical protein WKG00_21830 [Polyangiaceae bacterium]
MPDPRLDLDAWVELSVELSDPVVDRASVLRARGLDEDAWEALDDAWQQRLSDADAHLEADGGDPDAGVPALVAAHAEAFVRAQAARTQGPPLDFAAFVELTRAIERQPDISAVLRRFQLTLQQLLRSQAHWTKRMLEDPELARRFDEARRGR